MTDEVHDAVAATKGAVVNDRQGGKWRRRTDSRQTHKTGGNNGTKEYPWPLALRRDDQRCQHKSSAEIPMPEPQRANAKHRDQTHHRQHPDIARQRAD
ncbi:MAG: hypothetical protein BWZ07_03104 [Alphaproteobacteria bacterium ADurb.BinA280]|nr:MAG: hypothetical protein BWZ07_03104 [Alphaproteobacteria bacterium ADurb.BinA280]